MSRDKNSSGLEVFNQKVRQLLVKRTNILKLLVWENGIFIENIYPTRRNHILSKILFSFEVRSFGNKVPISRNPTNNKFKLEIHVLEYRMQKV